MLSLIIVSMMFQAIYQCLFCRASRGKMSNWPKTKLQSVGRINSEGEVKIAASTKYSQLDWDGDGRARAAETRKTSSLCRSFRRPRNRNRTRIQVHAVDEKRGVQFFMLLFFLLYPFLQRPRAADSTKHGWNAALPFARLDPQLSTNIWDFSMFAGLCLQRHSPTSAAQISLSHRAQ